ncbi:hypothetical protein PTE30175_03515 [Pandoraea terrae]|uniref:Uncharacterized protein n=1 Tax=Pandoraea terrae TaxID=1537710 RepID=A0A5E4X1Z1_9BURK|nr:hypothetical protein PTE30175_03515 [Pandoraea terrae]
MSVLSNVHRIGAVGQDETSSPRPRKSGLIAAPAGRIRSPNDRCYHAPTFAACNNVEAAAGISLAKNQLAYRTETLKAEGAVPEMLMQILAKAEGK